MMRKNLVLQWKIACALLISAAAATMLPACSAAPTAPPESMDQASARARFEETLFELTCILNISPEHGSQRWQNPIDVMAQMENDNPGLLRYYEVKFLAPSGYAEFSNFHAAYGRLQAREGYTADLAQRLKGHLAECF